jgi:hypothetical protein
MILFVAKNNLNAEDKTLLAKTSSKEYYHETKYNWNKSKQKKCYARCPWWKEMIDENITSKTWKNTYKKYSWWKKTFDKILQRITTKKSQKDCWIWKLG